MKTKINDSNFEAIDDLMRQIRRRRKDIANLTQAMEKFRGHEDLNVTLITFAKGKSYETSAEILSSSYGEFVKALIPVIIGVLQAEIDNLYKEIEKL